ncbi:PLP-dependent aminotransferase family protein [Salinisphaera sp. SPP-AMP-43]|uniref:MocR-like pyridoxine biosynthesis transcription factor PdxR n=1 Tax=Salinisphaera sp. SPP-AMP-43 TaxID=3121288 RepID=UPI003C6E9294
MEPVTPDRQSWIVDMLRLALHVRPDRCTRKRCLYEALRARIQAGELVAGARLPSSRVLAQELAIGRNTALAALDHLVAEGFVDARPGAGLYVAEIGFTAPAFVDLPVASRPTGISQRGRSLLGFSKTARSSTGAFVPGLPALDAFPWPAWQRLLRRHRHRQRGPWLAYGATGGHPALKAAIADYARLVRNVRCEAGQILVTHGAQHAFDLIARMLADAGDIAWVEEPGYAGAKAAFTAAGLTVAAVPIDGAGLDPSAATAATNSPRLIHLTPSNQYPMGRTMSMTRRQELIEYAARYGAWIVEDDYDSEFRYVSSPLSALQGLTERPPVLYVGTFSKTMYPGLRLGYIVLPPALVEPMRQANVRQFREGDYAIQAALAEFMNNGGYAKHVARMRRLYIQRQQRLREVLASVMPSGEHGLVGGSAGLHMVMPLASHALERELVVSAAEQNIALSPLSDYYAGTASRPGLVLGYANVDTAEIDRAGRWLGRAHQRFGQAGESPGPS